MIVDVLVDTSVWIDYFQNHQESTLEQVTQLLKERRAIFTGIIALELLRGARSQKEISVLESLFRLIRKVSEQETTHRDAGKMGYDLSRKGITIGTVDILIGQLAIENGLSLYTHDHHFSIIANAFPLRLYGIG